MQLVLISPSSGHPSEIALARQFLEKDHGFFHVRKPYWDWKSYVDYLSEFPPSCLNKMVIHEFHGLCGRFPLNGIHLKEKDWKRRLSHPHENEEYPVISASFHQIPDLLGYPEALQYAFISPVYTSISKPDYKASFDFDALKEMNKEYKGRAIGLGGIDKEKLEEVKALGFHGAAVLGSIWNSPHPDKSLKELLDKVDKITHHN